MDTGQLVNSAPFTQPPQPTGDIDAGQRTIHSKHGHQPEKNAPLHNNHP